MPHSEGLPDAVIAVWGAVRLDPIDETEEATVASGGRAAGLLLSYLGDLQRSAKAGVPVYRIAGGAGYVWAATVNKDGRGALRFLTADASKYELSPQNSLNRPSTQQSSTQSQSTEPQVSENQTQPTQPQIGQQSQSSIVAEYHGHFTCTQGITNLTIQFLKPTPGSVAVAIFKFGPSNSNPNVPFGAFFLQGGVNFRDGRLELQPLSWLSQPQRYVMVGLSGTSSDEGKTFKGKVLGPNCTEFSITRTSTALSSPPNVSAKNQDQAVGQTSAQPAQPNTQLRETSINKLLEQDSKSSFESFIAERVLRFYVPRAPKLAGQIPRVVNLKSGGANCVIAFSASFDRRDYQKWDGSTDARLPSGEALIIDLSKAKSNLTTVNKNPQSGAISFAIGFDEPNITDSMVQYGGSDKWENPRMAISGVNGFGYKEGGALNSYFSDVLMPWTVPQTFITFEASEDEHDYVTAQLKALFARCHH
jgi:hypothetical protein